MNVSSLKKQTGAVMLVGLMVLLLMMIVGTLGLKMGQTQNKMTASMYDRETAFQSTETAVKAGETWLGNLSTLPQMNFQCSPQPCIWTRDTSFDVTAQDSTFWAQYGMQLTSGTIAEAYAQPYYVIEYTQFVPDDLTVGYGTSTGKYFFSVTGYGNGKTDKSISIIQTTYARRF